MRERTRGTSECNTGDVFVIDEHGAVDPSYWCDLRDVIAPVVKPAVDLRLRHASCGYPLDSMPPFLPKQDYRSIPGNQRPLTCHSLSAAEIERE